MTRFTGKPETSKCPAARSVRFAALTVACKEIPMNPLLSDWTTPFALAPFDKVEDAHFAPAFEAALEAARGEIAAIAEAPEPPDFANTIEALEQSGKALDKVLSVFFTVAGADSTPERQRLQRDFSPKLAA